jgi:hypothetical protein
MRGVIAYASPLPAAVVCRGIQRRLLCGAATTTVSNLRTFISRMSRADAQRPSCLRAMRQGGSRPICPTGQSKAPNVSLLLWQSNPVVLSPSLPSWKTRIMAVCVTCSKTPMELVEADNEVERGDNQQSEKLAKVPSASARVKATIKTSLS